MPQRDKQVAVKYPHNRPQVFLKNASNLWISYFHTFSLVKAVIAKGKNIGTYFGRIAVRTIDFFNISTENNAAGD
jgi:hypothetical protein